MNYTYHIRDYPKYVDVWCPPFKRWSKHCKARELRFKARHP